MYFSKFYGKVDVISFEKKNYVLYRDFNLKTLIMEFSLILLMEKKHHKAIFFQVENN